MPHPEFLSISPAGRTVIVFRPDELMDIIDTMMVVSIHVGNGKAGRGKKNAKHRSGLAVHYANRPIALHPI